MKIIKRGVTPKEKKYRGTCPSCKTEYEAVWGELTMISDEREGCEFGQSKCKVCGYHPVNFYEKRVRSSGNGRD